MPYPQYVPPEVHQTRYLDTTGLGPDPDEEYTGDSLEDFYDYLMTPRHQRTRTQQGAITHYGPSRTASINPEDAAMASLIMQQMEAADANEYNQGLRESDLGRRSAADALMQPQGGGSMTGPDGRVMPVGGPGPSGPMSERERGVAAAGGYAESRVAAAEAQGTGYPDRGGRGPSRTDLQAREKMRGELLNAEIELGNALMDEPGLAGKDPMAILDAYSKDPASVPDYVVPYLRRWAHAHQAIQNVFGGGGGGGGPAPGGSGRFNPETGQIER